MDRVDLFQEARSNEANLTALYASMAHQDGVTAFTDHVQRNARISINRGPDPVRSFLETDSLQNAFRAAKEQGTAIETFLEARGWPPILVARRVRLARAVQDGEGMIYGALNIGGPGTAGVNDTYGLYCIVLKDDASLPCDGAACCRTDMLFEPYWNGHEIQWNALKAALAPLSCKGILAAILSVIALFEGGLFTEVAGEATQPGGRFPFPFPDHSIGRGKRKRV